jgi:predicted small lipoprotein YifL
MNSLAAFGPRPLWRGTALALLLLLLVAGCGRKGPLFLPQEKLQEAEQALERRDGTSPPPAAPSERTPPNQTSQPPR